MSEAQTAHWVIGSGDEGLQLNGGIRIGFAGSGYGLPHFQDTVDALEKTLGSRPYLVSVQEDDWLSRQLDSKNQVLFDDTLSKFAAENNIEYLGQFDFGDPKDLPHEARGHLVRPPKIHVAERICLTIGGGERHYSLEQICLSADYAHLLSAAKLREILEAQINFYRALLGQKLVLTLETDGPLSDEVKAANRKALDPILSGLK